MPRKWSAYLARDIAPYAAARLLNLTPSPAGLSDPVTGEIYVALPVSAAASDAIAWPSAPGRSRRAQLGEIPDWVCFVAMETGTLRPFAAPAPEGAERP